MINLQLLFITSFFIAGINYLLDEGTHSPFSWFGMLCTRYHISPIALKPLYSCVICMASFWGTISYLLFAEHYNILQWVVFCVALAGLNRVLKNYL